MNSCTAAAEIGPIIYYSHLVPVAIAFVLVFFILTRSARSALTNVFSIFVLSFSVWLLGDLITWALQDYFLITFAWAPLDFINVIFYLLGAYFFAILLKGGDIGWRWKILLFTIAIPAWWITITGQSITGFDQSYCEALNNNFLTVYKVIIELLSSLFIIISGIYIAIKDSVRRRQIILIASALVLFFAVFSVTEYIASVTYVYEIHLYSLFVLPIFLGVIIYSITSMQIFKLKGFGTQLLTYTLIILVGSQFFFLESSDDKILTAITFILALSFSIILLRDQKKVESYLKQIETLAKDLKVANTHLEELSTQKSQFVSLATHQIRSPLTALQGYASLILEGDYGPMTKEQKEAVTAMYESAHNLITIVGDYLDISRIDLGKMKYDMTEFSLRDLITSSVHDLQPNLLNKPITLTYTPKNPDDACPIRADMGKVKQMVGNIIDNAIKYTPQGTITVSLEHKAATRRYVVSIVDTGVGIAPETKGKLFERFSRADDAHVVNTQGTGLGLFIVKQFAEAHGGRIWVESEGKGKGSQFYIDLPERAEDVK